MDCEMEMQQLFQSRWCAAFECVMLARTRAFLEQSLDGLLLSPERGSVQQLLPPDVSSRRRGNADPFGQKLLH